MKFPPCALCGAEVHETEGFYFGEGKGISFCSPCLSTDGAREMGQIFGRGIDPHADPRSKADVCKVVDRSLSELQLAFCQGVAEAIAERFWEELRED